MALEPSSRFTGLDPEATREQEKEFLEQQRDWISSQLDGIKKRLEELKETE